MGKGITRFGVISGWDIDTCMAALERIRWYHFTSLDLWSTGEPFSLHSDQFHVQSVRDVAREARSKSSHNVVKQPANIDGLPTSNVNARPQRCGVLVK